MASNGGWLGGDNFIKIKKWGNGRENRGPVGRRKTRPYYVLIRALAQRAKLLKAGRGMSG